MIHDTTAKALFPLLICMGFITGCASGDRVVRLYDDATFVGKPFSNILVLGVHENANLRRRFETSVAQELRSEYTTTASSLNYMRSTDVLNTDTLFERVDQAGFDAIFVSRLVDMQTRAKMHEGRIIAQAERRSDIPVADLFRYDYVEYQEPDRVSTVRTVVLVSELYDVASRTKVWSAETTSFEQEDAYEIISGISEALATALSQDGYLYPVR